MAESSPEHWMRRAVALSKRGYPAPNPHVGCVIVRDGEVVGEGFHARAGQQHAEANALAMAAGRAKGADVYVTLEPCNHQGRTPPCASALIRAGVRSVTFACSDPNPRAQGGAEALRDAGITVRHGILTGQAEAANRQFLAAHRLRRPVVTVKVAMTLDGRIALPSGDSKWITGDLARADVHRMRAKIGAVLVGANTALLDRSRLTVRVGRGLPQPVRIVLDPKGRLPEDLPIFDGSAPTIRYTSEAEHGTPLTPFTVHAVLQDLWERGVTGVMVEGGAATISKFFENRLVDAVEAYVAPKVFGGGLPWLCADLPSPLSLQLIRIKRFGDDVRLSYRRRDV